MWKGWRRPDHFSIPPPSAMTESTPTHNTDDQDLVAITSALVLEETEPKQKPRAPFGSR